MKFIGTHMPVIEDEKFIALFDNTDAGVVQIFLKQTNAVEGELSLSCETTKALRLDGVLLVAHAGFLGNAASDEDRIKAVTFRNFKNDLKICAERGFRYFVIHPGSAKTQILPEAIDSLVEFLNQLSPYIPQGVIVLLENQAGAGTQLCANLEEFEIIFDKLSHPEKFGVVLDICHAFVAGYDLGIDPDRIPEFLDSMLAETGNRVELVHVSNSINELASNKERHALIKEGQIPLPSMKAIANYFHSKSIPMVLETAKTDEHRISETKLLASFVGP